MLNFEPVYILALNNNKCIFFPTFQLTMYVTYRLTLHIENSLHNYRTNKYAMKHCGFLVLTSQAMHQQQRICSLSSFESQSLINDLINNVALKVLVKKCVIVRGELSQVLSRTTHQFDLS